jgi:OmpA family
MKHFVLILSLFGWSTSLFAQNTGQFRAEAYFDTDKSVLTTASQTTLNDVAERLKGFSTYQIVLKGNTDADGKDDYNQKLSIRRTQSVFEYLLSKGISASAISTAALGEKQPIADNLSASGKQANRRVDILVNYTIGNQSVTQVDADKNPLVPRVATDENASVTQVGTAANLENLFKQLANAPQNFQFRNDHDTILVCAKGSMVLFQAGSFDVPAGTPVKIQIKEILSKSDMFLENLTTTSGDKLLASGGMMQIEAFLENGQRIDLQGDKSVKVKIPTPKFDPQMQFFTGSRTENVPTVDWAVMDNEKANLNGDATADVNANRLIGRKPIEFPIFGWTPRDLPRTFEDNLFLMHFANDKDVHEYWKNKNYYKFYEDAILKDTCGALYSEKTVVRPADTTRRIVTHTSRNFWEQLTGVFTPKKDTLIHIRPARTTKQYEIVSNLSAKCKNLALLGKRNKMETAHWMVLDQEERKDLYHVLVRAFETTEPALLTRRLQAKVVEFDKQIMNYDSLNKKYLAKQDDIRDRAYKNYAQKRDAWYKVQDEAVAKAITSGNITKENLSYYFFQANKLGWLNCDYFTNDAESVLVDVGVKKRANLDAKIIFKDRMAAMNVNSQNDAIAFVKVPKGRKAWIVLMDFHQNSPRLALQEIETGKPVPTLEFKAMSVAQIRNELGRLNQP